MNRHTRLIMWAGLLAVAGCGRQEHTDGEQSHKSEREQPTNAPALHPPMATPAPTPDALGAMVRSTVAHYVSMLQTEAQPAATAHAVALDQHVIEHLNAEQALGLLDLPARQKCDAAYAIAGLCRNYEAGTLFFSNYYESVRGDPVAALAIGKLWGEFAMRHARSVDAHAIYSQAWQDGQSRPVDHDSAGVMAQLLQARVELYNMSRDFHHSADTARAYFDFVRTHAHLFEPAARAHYEEMAAWLYANELCNNEQYDEAAALLATQRSVAGARGIQERIRTRKPSDKTILSLGFGTLAN